MSTRAERDAVIARARRAWDEVARMLAERGETWLSTDITSWTTGLNLAMNEFRAIGEASRIIGGPGPDQLLRRFHANEPT
ncbi:hypothetical protein [Streptomonospora salina]|uniref:Uncharacterized protein n=1 Tax=Streptomonospora salina TaxID=104205 RepID=A0A841EAH1_9ACTN|nr:hypothetical protein [Streptomonospora salina]MBB6000115.1 hypothetical protein [Streptomonospora salina]